MTLTEEADQPSLHRTEQALPVLEVPLKPESSEMEGHVSAEQMVLFVPTRMGPTDSEAAGGAVLEGGTESGPNEATSSALDTRGVLTGYGGLPSSGTQERPSLLDSAVTRAAPRVGAHGNTADSEVDEAITLEEQIVREVQPQSLEDVEGWARNDLCTTEGETFMGLVVLEEQAEMVAVCEDHPRVAYALALVRYVLRARWTAEQRHQAPGTEPSSHHCSLYPKTQPSERSPDHKTFRKWPEQRRVAQHH